MGDLAEILCELFSAASSTPKPGAVRSAGEQTGFWGNDSQPRMGHRNVKLGHILGLVAVFCDEG